MRVLIVDDEQPNREGLKLMLSQSCPEIEAMDEAASAREARLKLASGKYDVLFLDINMPNENGFELLKSLPDPFSFSVVFVTAYSEYAIRAFRANAIDYLLKPVDLGELVVAVAKCMDRYQLMKNDQPVPAYYTESLANLKQGFGTVKYPDRLTLPHHQGFNIIESDSIICIEADGNYSKLHLDGGKCLLVTRPIREFEFLLNPAIFFRSHKSALINLKFLKEYSSADGHFAVMTLGQKIPVSRRKLDEFMTAVDALSKRI
jgi:two-component system, LytTR family, response regulator